MAHFDSRVAWMNSHSSLSYCLFQNIHYSNGTEILASLDSASNFLLAAGDFYYALLCPASIKAFSRVEEVGEISPLSSWVESVSFGCCLPFSVELSGPLIELKAHLGFL